MLRDSVMARSPITGSVTSTQDGVLRSMLLIIHIRSIHSGRKTASTASEKDEIKIASGDLGS